jgi:hypothetical protein
MFYGQLVYFMVVWSILWQFRLFYGNLVFFAFWYVFPRKIWQPWSRNDHAQYLGNGTIITKEYRPTEVRHFKVRQNKRLESYEFENISCLLICRFGNMSFGKNVDPF